MIVDLGWLFIGAWPLAASYYLFKVHRWRSLVFVAAYGLLTAAASIVGWFVRLAVSHP